MPRQKPRPTVTVRGLDHAWELIAGEVAAVSSDADIDDLRTIMVRIINYAAQGLALEQAGIVEPINVGGRK